MVRLTIDIATDGAGAFTGNSGIASGCIQSLRFVNTNLAATSDWTVTTSTGATVLTRTDQNGSATWYPRATATTTDGSTGITNSFTPIPMADEAIHLVIAQGGATTTGVLYIYVGE